MLIFCEHCTRSYRSLKRWSRHGVAIHGFKIMGRTFDALTWRSWG